MGHWVRALSTFFYRSINRPSYNWVITINPCHALAPCTFFLFFFYFLSTPHLCYVLKMIVDCLICCTIILYTSVQVWYYGAPKVLTEGFPLLFGIPLSIVIFSIVIFIVWTFSANKHRMNGWNCACTTHHKNDCQRHTEYKNNQCTRYNPHVNSLR